MSTYNNFLARQLYLDYGKPVIFPELSLLIAMDLVEGFMKKQPFKI
jgi:hypothetical protein